MSRTPLVLVFVVGVVSGYFARSAGSTLQQRRHATDVAAIEKLNREDVEATLLQDPKQLNDLWAEEAVAFYPGSAPAVGKQAIADHNRNFHAQYPSLKVLSYTSRYKNLQLENGVACEWFEKAAEYKFSPESPPVRWHAKGLVVLKRQSDGAWKVVMVWPE